MVFSLLFQDTLFQAESDAYSRDFFFILNRHTQSGQSQVCRVAQLRTDGVYCRESAGTGPVNLFFTVVSSVARTIECEQ